MSHNVVSGRPGFLRLFVVLVVGIVAIVATYFGFRPAPAAPPCGPDRISLEVNSSTEKADMLAALAELYNGTNRPVSGGRCATVSVHKTTSGTAMDSLATGWNPGRVEAPVPQVWTPTSSMWLGLLAQRGKGDVLLDVERPSITTSVLVVAMPKRMADALRGAKGERLGWSDILELATNPQGWGSVPGADPAWGRFQLGRDNAYASTSGLAATVATFHGATVKVTGRNGVRPEDLDDSEVFRFVHDVESSVARYGDDATEFMKLLYKEDAKREPVPYISALAVQEQLAFLYNQGAPSGDPDELGKGAKPNEPLVAIHPKDGTLKLDHPYVVLSSVTGDQRAAADDFRKFLLEPEQQREFVRFGFRDHAGRPNDTLARTLHFESHGDVSLIDPPPADLLQKMVSSWDLARRKARVLLVLDVSGSMGDPAKPKELTDRRSKLDLLKPAAVEGVNLLNPDDELALWTFSTGSPLPYQERVPMRRVGDTRQQVIDTINGLTPQRDTALYRTTCAAHRFMTETADRDRINAIVLLSDGENHDPGNNDPQCQDLDPVLNQVDATKVETTPIRIFTIPYGEGEHGKVLAEISARSKAPTYDASNPLDIGKVFISVFRNF